MSGSSRRAPSQPTPSREGARLQESERASAWILAPAAVLILVILGAIAVDSAVAYLGRQAVFDAAATAATDAASAGLSRSAYYGSGQLLLSPTRAEQIARAAVAADRHRGVTITDVAVTTGSRTVCVTVVGTVRAIFGRAVPGLPHTTTVVAHAVATATASGATSVAPTVGQC